MKNITKVMLLIVFVAVATFAFAQAEGDYRSKQTGSWDSAGNWEYYDGASWDDASEYPTYSNILDPDNNLITIQGSHTITIDSGDEIEVPKLLVDDGATLSVAGTYLVRDAVEISGTGTITVSGAFRDRNGSVSVVGAGSFTTTGSAVVETKNTGGLTASSSGLIRCTTKTYSASTHFIFSNTQAPSNTYGLPSSPYRVTVDTGTHRVTIDTGSQVLRIRNSTEIQNRFIFISGSTHSLSVALTYASGATLEYAGTSGQTTYTKCFPATSGPTNLVISNNSAAGVTLYATEGDRTLNGNLTLTSAAQKLDLNGKTLTVKGTSTINGGSITLSSGTFKTDGYSEPGKFISIAESDKDPIEYINNISVTTSIDQDILGIVKRKWSITGSADGTKNYSFSWNAADDGNNNWGGNYPIFEWEDVDLTHVSFDSGDPRTLTVRRASYNSGTYGVDHGDGQTLPVELTAFTAIISVNNTVRVDWLTLSETGVSGFYVLRDNSNLINEAVAVSPLIQATNSSNQMAYTFEDADIPGNGTYYYWLQVVDLDGGISYFGPTMIDYNVGGGGTPGPQMVTRLKSPYPNPFNPSVTIDYELATPNRVTIEVYNLKGQLVRTLVNSNRQAGPHSVIWNGNAENGEKVGTGTYFLKMNAGKYNATRKIVLIK